MEQADRWIIIRSPSTDEDELFTWDVAVADALEDAGFDEDELAMGVAKPGELYYPIANFAKAVAVMRRTLRELAVPPTTQIICCERDATGTVIESAHDVGQSESSQ